MNVYRVRMADRDAGPWSTVDTYSADVCTETFVVAASESDARTLAAVGGGDEPDACWTDTRWSICTLVARDALGTERLLANSMGTCGP